MILFGLIYAILGTVALMGKLGGVFPGHDAQETLIWLQVTQDTFSIFDCIALVLGVAIFYLAGKKN